VNHLKTNAPIYARKTVKTGIQQNCLKKSKNCLPIWRLGLHKQTTEQLLLTIPWTSKIESCHSRLPQSPLQSHRKAQRQWQTSGLNDSLTTRPRSRVSPWTACRASSKQMQTPILTQNQKRRKQTRLPWLFSWTSKWSCNKWSSLSWTQEAKSSLMARAAPKTSWAKGWSCRSRN